MDKNLIITFSISGISICALLILLAFLFKIKGISRNHIFGYRTPFSLSSDEAWKWCNNLFCKTMFLSAPLLMVGQVIILLLSLEYKWESWPSYISLFSPIVLILYLVPFIELYGRRKFHKNKQNPLE